MKSTFERIYVVESIRKCSFIEEAVYESTLRSSMLIFSRNSTRRSFPLHFTFPPQITRSGSYNAPGDCSSCLGAKYYDSLSSVVAGYCAVPHAELLSSSVRLLLSCRDRR